MDHSLESKFRAIWPPDEWQDLTVIVGVSGGPDSVGLLRLLHTFGTNPARLVAAHFNHGWRGAESDADAEFVRGLCQELDIPLEEGSRKARGATSEAEARAERYEFLQAVARSRGARFLVTGHTQDDQAETILHRILRGTGPTGLSGILRSRPLCDGITLLRPLLSVTKAEIKAYLSALKQPWRDDSSNLDESLTRNSLRIRWLPELARDVNPRVNEALCRLGELAQEQNALVDQLGNDLLEQALRASKPQRVCLDCVPLTAAHPLLIRTALRLLWQRKSWPEQEMSRERWQQLALLAMGNRSAPAVMFPGNVRAEVTDGLLVLSHGG